MTRSTLTRIIATAAVFLFAAPVFAGEILNGVEENGTDAYGYYYIMTGGKFPTGTIPNGDNGSGGTFRFLVDTPAWGGYALDVWNKDDWFPQNASFAVTLKNAGTIVYDNNGLEDGSYGDYYDASALATSTKPGLYRGYSMSNNWDWIYAGYFKLEQATTIDQIIGYYDENSGFDSNSPEIRFDMNIWSSVEDTSHVNSYLPAVASFTGDVFAARNDPGTFSWSDTGVDRIFGADYGYMHDDILRLTYTLDTPLTLQPGVYFFSHDAEIAAVPLPSAAWAGLVLLGGLGFLRRRRR